MKERSLPQKLMLYFSPDETPLFKIRSSADKELDLFFGLAFMAAFVAMFLFFGLFFKFFLILWLIIPVVIIGILCIWKNPVFKSEQLLLLTNKRVYLYLKRHSYETVDSANFSDLKAVIYRKRRFLDRNENVGTIDFIAQDHKTAKFSINHVSEIRDCQRIIESILYTYGGFQERWAKIKLKLDFEFPYTCYISKDGLERISRRHKRLNMYLGIIWGITLGITWVVYLYFPYLFISGLIIMLGGTFTFLILTEKYLLRKRSVRSTDTLTLEPQKVSYSTESGSLAIRLTPETCLDAQKLTQIMGALSFKTEEVKYKQIKWYEDDLAFQIKPSYDSNLEISFGPVAAFPDIYELLFCYIINWKGEQNYLLSKEQIFQLEKQELDSISIEIKKLFATKTPAIVAPEDLAGISPEEYEYLYSYLYPFLTSDEEIKVVYSPKINTLIRFLISELSIIGILVGIFLIFFRPFDFLAGFIPELLIMFSSMSLIFNIIYIFGETTLKNSVFIFTTHKLIITYPKSQTILDYDNIASIVRKDKKKIYNIELNLRNPIKSIPLSVRWLMALKYNILNKPTVLVPEVSQDNDLIEQINFLRAQIS
ncbi:MAG: hypothetical protein ACTSRS_09640 [Candidatus Helarchaeota archaeon]